VANDNRLDCHVHKGRIWCRLRGNTRCNHPPELD
jgi:hypothetical protein